MLKSLWHTIINIAPPAGCLVLGRTSHHGTAPLVFQSKERILCPVTLVTFNHPRQHTTDHGEMATALWNVRHALEHIVETEKPSVMALGLRRYPSA